MPRRVWSRVFRAVVVAIGLSAAAASAGAADPQPAPAAAPPSGVATSRAQAQDLIDLLQDPARRTQLIGALQALEKTLPATPTATPTAIPAAAAAPSPASPPAAPTTAARAVPASGLLAQLVLAAPEWASRLGSQFASLRRLLAGIPQSWAWLTRTATDGMARQYLMRVGIALAVAVAPATAAWLALRWLLRRYRARLGALAVRGAPAGTTPQARPTLARRLMLPARKLLLALLAFVLDVAPVAAFAAVGFLLVPVLTQPDGSDVLVLGVIDAATVFGVVLCVARTVLAPDAAPLRLVPLSDPTAVTVVRGITWMAGIAVFGTAALNVALLLGLDPSAKLALEKLVLLADHLLLVAIVLRYRHPIAAHLRSPKRRSGAFAAVLNGLAEVWHIVAVFLIIGLWLIWAADWQHGYGHLLAFVATAVAVGIVTRLLTAGLLLALEHELRVGAETSATDDPTSYAVAARPRAARYYPVLRIGISAIMTVTGILVVLQLSGISSIGWLFGSTLGRQVSSAVISILVTLGVAVVAWEGLNIALDRHLDRLSRQAQLARATRMRTLQPMLRTAVASAILVVVALTTLSEIGVNIAPLLAGAGIVGVAIGFGSQKLVQDLITGVFLLLEDAMHVGDFVSVAGVSGVVETLSIRTIHLRAGDGSLHIIPFSSVTMVNNTNRGLGNAAVSVTVAAREDPDEVGDVLKAIVTEMRDDPGFKPMILSDLQLWGVDKVDGASVVLVGQIVCTDSGRWGVQREFNRRYKKRFLELGIEIPNPTQTLLLRHATSARPRAAVPNAPGESTATVSASPPSSSLGHTA